MNDLQDHLLILALAVFFFGIGWLMLRIAAASAIKQDFLASCLCVGGAAAVGGSFFYQAWLPIDQFGCTHEPGWADAMINGGFVALTAGHLVKCWSKPSFLWASAAIVLGVVETASPVRAILPALAGTLLAYVRIILLSISAQAWTVSVKQLEGSFFSVKTWRELESKR